MRNEVLQFLKNLPTANSDKFNKAFELLRKTKGVNFNQVRVYNANGTTTQNIKNILYDLKKLYGITDAEILSKRTAVEKLSNKKQAKSFLVGFNSEGNPVINVPYPDQTINTGSKILPNQTINTGSKILPNQTINTVSEVNKTDKKTDLHKEFPFLSTKECPAEMHIVTGLLVASWKRYNTLHAELQKATTEESELSEEELAQLTANTNAEFELNGKLYKELEHYRDNQAVLGEIDELKEYRIAQEIATMSVSELVKEQKNAASYLTKQKKELEAEDLSDERKALIESRIAERELRLSHVNTKLNIS